MDFVLSTILNLGYRPPPNGNQEGADPILILTNEGESAYTDRAEEGKIEYPPVGTFVQKLFLFTREFARPRKIFYKIRD